jgi:MFS family permease
VNTVLAVLLAQVRLIGRAFESRNYRLYFGGMLVSMTGSWMQTVAMSWLVYRLTNSAMLLGITAFLTQVPSLVFGPWAGVLADRVSRRRMIMVTQSAGLLQAGVLAALVGTDAIATWHLLVLATASGMVTAFDAPARQSFIVHIVTRREHLQNAIALNSLLFNGARLLGPAVAGLLITAAGEYVCFLLNAASYAVSVLTLLLMQVYEPARAQRQHPWQELRAGFGYVLAVQPARAMLLLTAFSSLVALPFNVVMPIFAREVLHGDARTLGFLNTSIAAGALLGAIYMASRVRATGLQRIIAWAAGLFGAGLLLLACTRVTAAAFAAAALVGLGVLLQLVSTNTMLQTIVAEQMRGRVISLYTTAHLGIVPFGALLVGAATHAWGAPAVLAVCGVLSACAALAFAWAMQNYVPDLMPQAVVAAAAGVVEPAPDRLA